ncbi:MAG: GAF domain-containing protein [Syntrophales bacterium]|jgi:GAF domain-containing protein
MEDTKDILLINEEIARKFADIAARFPSTTSVQSLFETLLNGLEEEFGIPYMWITVIDDPPGNILYRKLLESECLEGRLHVIERPAFMELTGESHIPILINHDLKPYFRLMPVARKYLLRSLAVAPIVIEDKVIGSMNYGDVSETRYHEELGVTLLGTMMDSASIHLARLLREQERE